MLGDLEAHKGMRKGQSSDTRDIRVPAQDARKVLFLLTGLLNCLPGFAAGLQGRCRRRGLAVDWAVLKEKGRASPLHQVLRELLREPATRALPTFLERNPTVAEVAEHSKG